MLVLSLLAVLQALLHGPASATKGNSMIASAWYAGWHADSGPAFSLSQVSWNKYSQLNYAFAETTGDVRVVSLNGSSPEVLPQFVSIAHANGVKAKVSVGGWTGSRFWSSNVATPQNRTLFVKTLVDLVAQYGLDGLDFDWEYPGASGIGCNTNDTVNDTANFLAFIQELRADPIGSKLILSAATSITPFIDSDGNPSDVSGFSEVLDYIAIMVYDLNGPWSSAVEANAPLNDSCAPSAYQNGSAISAVHAWNAAGMPMDQIVLGVASYGHSFRVSESDAFTDGCSQTQLALYVPFNVSDAPVGDSWDGAAGPDECGNPQGPGGIMNFWGLIQQGYLNADGIQKDGVPYLFDECSQTAYVYNKTTEVMISFDNAQSFGAKGGFLKSKGLGGFSMWEAGGDSGDILLDSIRESAGY
ncbi:glycoside hydrolase family 18 protein [Mycena olivaceomarginata]|nr:glycoside hydrolase family 18 protein [Mycena olivaceomarginata]